MRDMITFIVIGISDNPKPWFPPEVMEIIQGGRVFSGGKRHHEIVASLLPEGAEWIDITVPLDAVFKQYISRTLSLSSLLSPLSSKTQIIVFASGDPLFFGFANTIKRKMPDAEIVLYPTFNSLQMLAHRVVMPYHDMRIVSLTGRPWPEFDRALIERTDKIGILTDREHSPASIARRMLDYGYTDYTMHIGEHLGNPQEERITTLTLEEAASRSFSHPNCLILNLVPPFPRTPVPRYQGDKSMIRPFGLPENEFTLLDGREKMITKMPIRLLTLQALDLPCRRVLWDIGFCTGSVSIEARLLFPHLHVEAFEIRPECETIIHQNALRFGAPGIEVHIGDFLETDISVLPRPDAVFIGGHGGRLKEIMTKVLTVLANDGCMVMNSVKAPKVHSDSHRLWNEACETLGLTQAPPLRIQLNDHHPITILKCRK